MTIGVFVLGAPAFGSETSQAEETDPCDAVAVWASGGVRGGAEKQRTGDAVAELRAAYAAGDSSGLRQAAMVVARFDGRLSAVVESPRAEFLRRSAGPPAWLAEGDLPVEVKAVIAAFAAERLFASRHYEECLAWLDGVHADDSPAPALVRYLRAASLHQLVRLEEAAEHAQRLLDNPSSVSRRHAAVAELIVRDAWAVNPDTAGHLARPMGDIERRLQLGRAGTPEQSLQREVLEALDKLIDDAEQQQQQQQSASAAGAQSAPSQAAPDSRPSDLKGPGEVDRRQVAKGGDWGSLPPRERERVTQQIARDFPAYYRDMIEAYFRSLATGEPPPGNPPAGSEKGGER